MLRVITDARPLGQLVNSGQAHPAIPAAQKQALDLLGQFVLDYLPALAAPTVRDHE
jgi:hypothetical protein